MLDKISGFVRAIVGEISSDLNLQQLMETAASRVDVTRHPYGFYIWRIPWPNSVWQLRVHLWLPEKRVRQLPDWPIHTHNGHLHSFILKGAVTNQDYVFHENPEASGAVYSVTYANPTSILTKTARRGLVSEARRSLICQGQQYLVKRDCFHASEVDDNDTAITVVLLEMKTSTKSSVFGEATGPIELRFDRQAIEPGEAAEARRVLLSNIEA